MSRSSRPASRRRRRHRPRHARRSIARHSARRLLGAAVRERLLRVQARRRPHGLDARRPVGRAELEPLAGQPLRRRRRRCTSMPPRAIRSQLVGDKVIPPIGAHGQRVRPALQDPEPHAHEVLGPADLPRRHRAAAARLRKTIHQLSGALLQGHFSTAAAAAVRAGRRSRHLSPSGSPTTSRA